MPQAISLPQYKCPPKDKSLFLTFYLITRLIRFMLIIKSKFVKNCFNEDNDRQLPTRGSIGEYNCHTWVSTLSILYLSPLLSLKTPNFKLNQSALHYQPCFACNLSRKKKKLPPCPPKIFTYNFFIKVKYLATTQIQK